jgi:predicted DsbA family dithiol-disulfide isomerase
MLDSRLPSQGADKLEHYTRKFGPRAIEMIKDPNNALNQRGRPIGIEFNYVPGCRVFNSRKAHKLLTWAVIKHSVEAQATLKEILLRKYFKDCLDLGRDAELLKAVEEAGLPVEPAKAMLDGTSADDAEIEEHLEAELVDSHSKVTGVPAFYFPGGIEISGGQTNDVFQRVIVKSLSVSQAKP